MEKYRFYYVKIFIKSFIIEKEGDLFYPMLMDLQNYV